MVELLAPAGNLEKLNFAIHYGADCVYFGLKKFSLREYAGNFTLDEAEEGLELLHSHGKKGFCTMNVYPFQEEYEDLVKNALILDEMGVDAVIVSDPGVFFALKKSGLKARIHISTQANILSSQAALAYYELGAARVNLARELSFERIKKLMRAIGGTRLETEVFIHGSVCFSYSGRCAISDYLTGRRANQGKCTHPCRWKYRLEEEKRPGIYLPVTEDDKGVYLFNSKDIALFTYVKKLTDIGITSFKIEGRMKSIHYLASIVSLYRRIINGENVQENETHEYIDKVGVRSHSEGFMKGEITSDDYITQKSQKTPKTRFLGNVINKIDEKSCLVQVRNKIIGGEQVEVLKPDGTVSFLTLPKVFKNAEHCEIDVATHLTIILPFDLPAFTIIRKNT